MINHHFQHICTLPKAALVDEETDIRNGWSWVHLGVLYQLGVCGISHLPDEFPFGGVAKNHTQEFVVFRLNHIAYRNNHLSFYFCLVFIGNEHHRHFHWNTDPENMIQHDLPLLILDALCVNKIGADGDPHWLLALALGHFGGRFFYHIHLILAFLVL